MVRRYIGTFILLFALVYNAKATNNDSITTRIFTLIYDQNLTEAEAVYQTNIHTLNEFYKLFLNLDLHWWKYRTTYSKENSQALDKLIYTSVLPQTDTYEQKMRQIIVKSYQLRFEKKQFNIFAMLSARSDIRDLIREIENESPPFSGDEQKLFESYVIMYQYIENINFFANAKKSAERVKKLNRMKKLAAEDSIILQTISNFFLARMNQKIEDEPQTALSYYRILTAQYPTNQTFSEYQAECEEEI